MADNVVTGKLTDPIGEAALKAAAPAKKVGIQPLQPDNGEGMSPQHVPDGREKHFIERL